MVSFGDFKVVIRSFNSLIRIGHTIIIQLAYELLIPQTDLGVADQDADLQGGSAEQMRKRSAISIVANHQSWKPRPVEKGHLDAGDLISLIAKSKPDNRRFPLPVYHGSAVFTMRF